MGRHVLRRRWGKSRGQSKLWSAQTYSYSLRPWPVNIRQLQSDKTEIAQHPCKGHLHPGLASLVTEEPPQQQDESRGTTSFPQIYQVHREERCGLAFKWALQHVCWFCTSGSGRAAAGMTPDRKYRLWCFRVPKSPSASGVHKPPGSSNYDILTHNKQYLTPGEISLIFNLA